jgi:hypothetical protein
VKSALRATGQFSGDKEIPLWRRFVEWRKATGADLRALVVEAESYLFQQDNIDPGAYLHIAHDAICIAKDGGMDATDFANRIDERIRVFSEAGKIPQAVYGRDYGWGAERGFSYGGYAFDIEEPMSSIVGSMKKAQYAAFERNMTAEANRLVDLFGEDLSRFTVEFFGENGRGGFSRTEILYLGDFNKFTHAIFQHVDGGYFDEVGATLEALADRLRSRGSFAREVGWFSAVKNALIAEAETAGPTAKAQISWFLRFNWKFPATESSGGSIVMSVK